MAQRTHLTGYAAALIAGTLWGTTGPLSTALYAEGADLAGVGFWRIAVASVGLLALFGQSLSPAGWAGLALVVAGVTSGYVREGSEESPATRS